MPKTSYEARGKVISIEKEIEDLVTAKECLWKVYTQWVDKIELLKFELENAKKDLYTLERAGK